MSELMTADLEARRRIREDVDTNFFVEAGAGSGKTTALVDRMVAMVENGIEVEKICAITFTVAASREFFNRFQQKLKKRRDDPDVPEVVKERIRTAIRHIDLCFMGTIDSFCNRILGEHPTRAGVPSALSLAEDTEKAGLYRREYAKLKRGEYGQELLDLFREFSAAQSKPDEAFAGCIEKFMGAHAAHWVLPGKPEEDWRITFAPQLDELLGVLEILESNQANLSEQNKECRTAKEALSNALRNLREYKDGVAFPDVQYVIRQISASEDESKMSGLTLLCEPGSIGIQAESLFTMRGKKTTVYCLTLSRKGGLINQLQEYQYAITVRFLSAFAVAMAKVLKANGELSYYDYLLYLRNMLREDAAAGGPLVRHIRAHYSRFLIDEFQDTDPIQAEVFFRLASDNTAEDWRDARPVPGSLFIVGDPKQSIYRFRGADVSSYLSVKQLFVPPVGEVLSLQQNFRSSGTLRRWFNDTFETLLPEETTYQSKFETIPIEDEEDGEGLLTGAWTYLTSKKDNFQDVADIICVIVDNPDFLIHPRKEKEPPRRIRYQDIMVITRTTTNLAKYLAAMKDHGIPCRVNGRTLFSDCAAFVAMADLLSAFADPSDSTAVYKVLRGHRFQFSREEITAWVQQGNKLRLYGHEEKAEEDDISAALVLLNEFRKRSIMLSPSALCQAMLEEFRLFTFCGTEDMEYVWYAIELLRNSTDSQGNRSLTDAAAYLKGLAESKDDTGSVLDLNGKTDQVYLANLHKVKGLEAPVVILAQTSAGSHSPEIHMEMDETEQKRWALKLTGGNHNASTYAVTERYEEETDREAINLNAEETRLMYVAATRAGCVLLIPKTDKCVWDSLLTAETKDFMTKLAPLSEKETEKTVPEEYGFEQDPKEWAEMTKENPLLQEEPGKKSWELSLPSDLHDSEREPETIQEPDPDADLPRGETSSLLLGTAIHRAMEMLVSSRAGLKNEAILEAIREEYSLEENEEDDVLDYVRKVLETVRRGGWKQESNIPEDILSELLSADEVYCEVPFCVVAENKVTNGVMDVVYRKDDAWYVVDYKTNADPYGLDVVYKDQLAAYRLAIRQLFNVVAEVHTYHIPLMK